ncbi:superoxide dismutase family protein [Nocardia sp. CA2R105]|uniref:superoxide dismutase[Cu-Zn] n=1 Tax=Nocardia coffeae TaxID=2873381 RepID=UPI001CA77592|nr:superoxide dismutase family protein [Nocardia coffeae]MBY8863670.1 superoxide dismutase family protein [Nocardia coffeae]
MAPFTTRRPSWRIVTPVLAVAVFGLAACTNSQESSNVKGTTPPVWTGTAGPTGAENPTESVAPAGDSVSVPLKDPSGQQVGTATIASSGGHLELTVDAHGLQPGFHGLHIHSVGKCEPNSVAPAGGAPGNFLSAGGHLQVGDAHAMPASGDLTSLQVRKDGSAHLVTTSDAVTLDQVKGKALIIHAGEDNFGNIPTRYTQANGTPGPDADTQATGDAGGRIACGVIG